ncbi:alanine--tRNA ligase [Patescibacteria group bacterium]|nr:alanine--tRNA ligase [Patescibacteria group bacterium]
MTSKKIRQKYLDFFKSKGHKIIPSASLIPENDSTTFFIGSGMQPLASYLLGEKHSSGNRLVNTQKCFRAEDIEEVGDHRHNTFFEMLGNWSLGDYFKQEQLSWIFEFLTKELDLDPNRLYITVFRGNKDIGINQDNASVEIWKKIFKNNNIQADDVDFSEKKVIQGGRIFYYDEKKNWWSRSGVPDNMPIGEIGGPDSEIFYDLGADLKLHENSIFKNQLCHVNCDCGRFIEIGNSVFMEYVKTKNGFEKLSQKNVDFGGGLERIVMVAQNKTNVFETDIFSNIINKIEQLSGKEYQKNTKSFEIIADHLKAAVFIIGDDNGIVPSNIGQGYIVRRLIRRAIRYGRQIMKHETHNTQHKVAHWTQEIAKVVIYDYSDIYSELKKNIDFILEELKKEEVKFSKTLERGLLEFEKLVVDIRCPKNKELNSEASEFNSLFFGHRMSVDGKTAFNLYQTYGFPIEMTKELAEEKGMSIDEDGFQQELKKHQELSKTASAGKFKGGLADSNEQTKKLHTAAHLLLAALRKVLGSHVVQKGSNITAERLRFDFLHQEKMTEEQKQEVEKLVNQAIQQDLDVTCEEMTLEQAKNKGAMGVFEHKYGKKVKVYTIGDFSKEICGGPHVEKTGELGNFKIKKEQSSSAGVRRVKAILF